MSVCLTFSRAFVFVSLSVLYNVAACGGIFAKRGLQIVLWVKVGVF